MEACIQPLIGGIISLQCLMTAESADSQFTLQGGAEILMPREVISSTSSSASLLFAPDWDSERNFFAFLSTIHRVMLLPRPPRPPAMT